MNQPSLLSRASDHVGPSYLLSRILEEADLTAPFFIFRQCSLHSAGKHPYLPQADAEEEHPPDGRQKYRPFTPPENKPARTMMGSVTPGRCKRKRPGLIRVTGRFRTALPQNCSPTA